jgi:hypothetical protein
MIAAAASAYSFIKLGAKTQYPVSAAGQDSLSVRRPLANRVRAGVLWPQLRPYLKVLGDRLEQSGKERLMLNGMLERAGEQRVAFAGILEFPDRLRLITPSGWQSRTLIYNGEAARTVGTALGNADQDLIESLVNDSAEHFFKAQAEGAPTRHLGDRFRADDGLTENYNGPYYDVFSLQDKVIIGSASRSQTKLYYFDSDTQLLDRVTYEISRNGETIAVETRFGDWQKVQDQQVAHRIVRLENDQPVVSLTVTAATVAARLNDGLF